MNTQDTINLLRTSLDEAALLLRKYEAHHRAKNTSESLEKAEVNAEVAGRFERTLAATQDDQVVLAALQTRVSVLEHQVAGLEAFKQRNSPIGAAGGPMGSLIGGIGSGGRGGIGRHPDGTIG